MKLEDGTNVGNLHKGKCNHYMEPIQDITSQITLEKLPEHLRVQLSETDREVIAHAAAQRIASIQDPTVKDIIDIIAGEIHRVLDGRTV